MDEFDPNELRKDWRPVEEEDVERLKAVMKPSWARFKGGAMDGQQRCIPGTVGWADRWEIVDVDEVYVHVGDGLYRLAEEGDDDD
jgi:hypothetical protein